MTANELDVRGKVCPDCTVAVYQALSGLPRESPLVVLSDYPPARQTIPQLARQFDRECEISDEKEGYFQALIHEVTVSV